MRLEGVLGLLRDEPAYRDLLRGLERRAGGSGAPSERPASLGLLSAARPYLIAALQCDWPAPIIVVSGRPENARLMADQIAAWSSTPERVLYFHAPDTVFYDRTPWHRETVHARVNALYALTEARGQSPESGDGPVVCSSVWSLMARSVPPMAFRRAVRTIKVGDIIPLYRFLEQCVRAGYESVAVVEDPGTFSHRGSIVDIYPPHGGTPLRIDFFGDEIDSIRTFNPGTQRSSGTLAQATLTPASEALPEWGKAAVSALKGLDLAPCDTLTQQRMGEEREQLIEGTSFSGIEFYLPYLYPRPSTLLDFLPKRALVLLDDEAMLQSASMALENQALRSRSEMIEDGHLPANYSIPYFAWQQLSERLQARHPIELGQGTEESPKLMPRTFISAPSYGGQIRQALADIVELRNSAQRVVVVTRQAERLSDLMREQNVFATPREDLIEAPERGTVELVDGILAEGWALSSSNLVVLTDAEVFGWQRLRRRRPPPRRRLAPESLFADLKDADYVVHLEHGIGRYRGLVRKTIGELEREYLEIEYAQGDRLFVPIHQADRVSRYLGADERVPHMHRLGGAEWSRIRERADRAIRDMAAELLELYVAREVTPGHAFAPDSEWQHELEASFPYEETDDQLSALAEVKQDMELPRPMDRLICGDVGYGKTEVALRAAFKSVMDGKQVAVLVPTTVLAQQHFYTFRRRLRAFPVVVEMLSRFRSPREQRFVLQDLTSGHTDIVIGTHRLLSNDVSFKDLGLVIIDEEQRFGVSHKEHLKQLRRAVDVLTLTATPIPRTMYMSLSGIRDMSLIDTPPEDRLAVRTVVAEHDEELIRKAISRELDRGGQIYFVHNRVYDIELVAEDLQRIVPEASLVIGHGQMPENELAQVMLGFAQGEHDMLLCTTIIESGLDIPNVNTIIIDRADTFGLAQLYQLRGRVGRGVERAYAYLLHKPPLSEIAHQRLQTIEEASELGAGYRVAMRDMEIRGAGEILGAEQHGHIAAIGFDLYTRLLRQAVEELREGSGESMAAIRRAQHKVAAAATVGGPGAISLELGPSIDLPVSAYLPQDYARETQLRLRLYRRLARVANEEEVDLVTQELADRFGTPPEPVSTLLYLLRLRVVASDAGVQSIRSGDGEVAIALSRPHSARIISLVTTRHPHTRGRGTRIWVPLGEGWQPQLLEVLRTIGQVLNTDLVPDMAGDRR